MFTKGKSGNPSGRKSLPPELRKDFTDTCPEVLAFWKEVMRDPTHKMQDRLRASENIFNRTYGTPVAAVDIDASVNTKRIDLSGMQPEQLDALLEAVTSVIEVPPSDSVEESEE